MGATKRLTRIEQKLDELLAREALHEGYLDVRRASAYLSLSPKTVRRLIHEGKIPGFRVEGKILIPLAGLETFVQRNPVDVIDIKGMASEIMAKLNS